MCFIIWRHNAPDFVRFFDCTFLWTIANYISCVSKPLQNIFRKKQRLDKFAKFVLQFSPCQFIKIELYLTGDEKTILLRDETDLKLSISGTSFNQTPECINQSALVEPSPTVNMKAANSKTMFLRVRAFSELSWDHNPAVSFTVMIFYFIFFLSRSINVSRPYTLYASF